MTAFDFSGYRNCPRGWRILRADSELWLDHVASNRVYMIRCPMRGEFELFFEDDTCNRTEPQFVARADNLYRMLQMTGCLLPQPSMSKLAKLAAEKEATLLTRYNKRR